MTKPHKSYRLLLISNGSTRMREFALPHWKIVAGAAVTIVLVGAIVFSISKLLANWLTQRAMSAMISENQELKQHLTRINERLHDVDDQLNLLAKNDDKLRLIADIPTIDKDVREVGVGGVIYPNIGTVTDDQTVSQLIFDLDKIEREIRLQQTSFAELDRQFKDKADLISHTPSVRPVEGGFVSSGFGYRADPFTSKRTLHKGVDISVERGTPVTAAADGKVIFAQRTPGLGNLVVIDHGYGFKTAYGHLSTITTVKGRNVKRSDKVGEVGSTGRSTAPHLHYEVRVDGAPVDPLDFMFLNYAGLPENFEVR